MYIMVLWDKLIQKASVQCPISLKRIYRTWRLHVLEEVVVCI